MNPLYNSVGIFLLGYAVGAIPVGPLVAYCSSGNNLLAYGSGNAGATNVGRLLGIPYFFIVLLLDAAKAYLYLKVCLNFGCSQGLLLAGTLGLLIGNSYSIFLKGRGGKGVATGLGILLFFFSYSMLILLMIAWLAGLLYTRSIGIASCIAAVSLVLLSIISKFFALSYYLVIVGVFIGLYVLWRHSANLKVFVART